MKKTNIALPLKNDMKRFITKYLLFLSLFASVTFINAQSRTIKGKVTDENGESLPGVTLLIEGTTNGTVTDLDGIYTLEVNEGEKITVTYIGFKDQVISLNGRTQIDVTLESSIEELEEVVVIGYGVQRKKVLTGSIERVSSEEITSTPIVRADQALQGRVAGVQVLNASGQPGEQPSIRIRGVGTDGDSRPLYLVDGIAVAGIDNLNPADIQSVEVLKDAASTSIYGARAANGVVLITTKSGIKGKATVTYDGYYGFQNSPDPVDLLNASEYQKVMSDANATSLDGTSFDPNQIPTVDTDWQKELYSNNVPIQSHYIGIEGASDKSSYSGSISYFDQQGIIGEELSSFERYSARLRSDIRVNSVFKYGGSINYSHTLRRGIDGNSSFNGELGSALNIDPLTAIYEKDSVILSSSPSYALGRISDDNGNVFAVSENIAGEIVNPLARLQLRTEKRTEDQILTNVYMEFEPLKNLTIRTMGGSDLVYRTWDSYQPLYYLTNTIQNTQGENPTTSVTKTLQRQWSRQWENTINYRRKIGERHNINVLFGTTLLFEEIKDISGSAFGINVANPNLRYLSLGLDSLDVVNGGFPRNYSLASFFSRVLYDYNDRISFSFSQRRDGSSRFGSSNKYANFYAFGVSWVINEEPFFPQWDKLSFLKLRASWGQNGNDRIGEFRYASTVDFNIAYNQQLGAVPAFFANEGIKWESNNQLDLAIETGFLENRLSLSANYYKRITEDLLQPVTAPSTLGFNSGEDNVGSVKNEGIELVLGWRDKTGDFSYSISANASYNKNIVTKVASEAGFIQGRDWALAGEVTRIIENEPLVSFFGYQTDGIFQSEAEVNEHISQNSSDPFRRIQPNAEPGDIRFVDVNGDGQISGDDRVAIGSPLPDWTVGSNLSFGYKNFEFSALLTGQLGLDAFDGLTRTDRSTSNRQSWILNQWSESNPTNEVPRLVAGDPNQNYRRATDMINIQNGSYLRIRNIQFGYRIPGDLLKRINCTSWRWYVALENVATFTSYRGTDPEIGAPEVDGVPQLMGTGIDAGIYPQARTIRFGTTITF